MKILHLISSSGLFGAERVVLTLASQNSGLDCWVGALNNFHNPHLEVVQEAQSAGMKTVVFDSRSQVDLKTVFDIKSFLRKNGIDIVHTHNYKSDMVGFWATRFSRTRWVATNHTWHSTDAKMRFYERLDAWVLKFAQKIFTVSEEIKEQMQGKGFKEGHIEVIHNGISVDQFQHPAEERHLRKIWDVSDEEVLLGIVGRLAPEKGHKVLFKALALVVKQFPYVKCVVVGAGPLKEALEEMVKNLNLSGHVIFAGIRQDMPAVYANCDIMVNASSIEGLPMTVLEAMACELPVIATKVGAVPRVICHEKNGILLRPNDPQDLADALVRLIENPGLRRQLAAQAYLDVNASFTDKVMSDQYKQSYKTILSYQ